MYTSNYAQAYSKPPNRVVGVVGCSSSDSGRGSAASSSGSGGGGPSTSGASSSKGGAGSTATAHSSSSGGGAAPTATSSSTKEKDRDRPATLNFNKSSGPSILNIGQNPKPGGSSGGGSNSTGQVAAGSGGGGSTGQGQGQGQGSSGQGSSSQGLGGNESGSSGATMPNKPTRYTPVYPTLMSTNPGKASSYSSLLNSTPYNPYNRIPVSQPQPVPLEQQPPQSHHHHQVITAPPKSVLASGPGPGQLAYESRHQYYHPSQRLQQHQQTVGLGGGSGVGITNLNNVSSKSAQNLIDSIPDVFCLSCPPAEFKFSDAYRAKTLPRTGKENERLIGFATLPEQVHRKSVKKGFDFTLMVVGESGLGKSTLINSLFLADFYRDRKIPSASDLVKKTTTIQKHTTEIEERGVKLRLTVVDTPGFGDSINCEESWKTCVDYIDEQFNEYFQAESGLNRKHIVDGRVHCCLYFIPSYGRGLRQLDIQALKTLQKRVNIIPVIGKSDILTPTEVRILKDKILEDLRANNIQMYQFPECDEEEDEEFKRQDRELKAAIPFAVASSDTFVEIAGRRLRGRVYPWGIVEVENPNHSDFVKLRTMLIQSHMHDLKETTQDLHYENFRARAIAQISQNPNKERTKLKRDSSADSAQDMLMQKEAEIKRMQQMISKMEAKLRAAGQPPNRGESIDI